MLPRAAWKPFAALGATVLFADGPRPGFRGGLGVQYDATPLVGAFFELAGEHFPTLPDRFDRTVLVPALGAQLRW